MLCAVTNLHKNSSSKFVQLSGKNSRLSSISNDYFNFIQPRLRKQKCVAVLPLNIVSNLAPTYGRFKPIFKIIRKKMLKVIIGILAAWNNNRG